MKVFQIILRRIIRITMKFPYNDYISSSEAQKREIRLTSAKYRYEYEKNRDF